MDTINKILGGLYRIELNNQIQLFDKNGNTIISFTYNSKEIKYSYKNSLFTIYSSHQTNGKTIYFGENGTNKELAIIIQNNQVTFEEISNKEVIHYFISNTHKEE